MRNGADNIVIAVYADDNVDRCRDRVIYSLLSERIAAAIRGLCDAARGAEPSVWTTISLAVSSNSLTRFIRCTD